MFKRLLMVLAIAPSLGGAVAAAEFDADAAHTKFMAAFNNRQWDEVKALLAEDSVFHRANAAEVYSGPDAIVGHFEQPIGGEWNVKFSRLDSQSAFTGKDGRVVQRGDFAITAGADDSSCYRGSYIMTWTPQAGDSWELQMFTWQDVEADLANCQ